MSEEAEPFLRKRLNNSPLYDYKFLAKLLDEYKNQFPPQEVTDEEIEAIFPTISSHFPKTKAYAEAMMEGAKALRDHLRSKLTNK